MIFFVWGSLALTRTIARGAFRCPCCGTGRDYSHKRVRRWFMLYFIPIIPLRTLTEYVECAGCGATWQPEALHATSTPTGGSLPASA